MNEFKEDAEVPNTKRVLNEWDGIGLPPVGTVCEFSDHGSPEKWFSCRVIAFDDPAIVFKILAAGHLLEYDARFADSLRPARTPEQIAAEEQENALGQMMEEFPGLAAQNAIKIIDAGYRKQVKP